MIKNMFSRLKIFLAKNKKPVLILVVALVFLAASIVYSAYNPNKITVNPRKTTTPVATTQTSSPTPPPKAAAKKAIAKDPPKYATSGTTSTSENSDGSKTTTVSEAPVNPENQSKAAAAGSSGSTPVSIHYIDETGKYPNLGNELANYLSGLLWSNEVSSLNAIIVEDAGNTGWAGLYSGSYTKNSGGQINSAWGYITLNTYYYQNSPYFVDYMKLILSHEYGHHYSLYHKWIDWQLDVSTRFPDSYYSVRPLPKGPTAPDYSLGWGNCDAEIIAEDYSYLYSGYGVHAMAGAYGYPSAGTKTWLKNEPSGSSGVSAPEPTAAPQQTPAPEPTAAPTAAPEASVTAVPVATTTAAPVADTQNPSVIITAPGENPYTWTNGNLAVAATATDNVAVLKIEFYVNDQLVATQNGGSINRTWMQNGTPAGAYTLKAKAYDTSGNTAETSIVVNKTF
ncbi:MAG: Ig-like domain-containing protein [Candidatus Berkelbacteria bacterium]|nr:Ig-like domain-containing protein [Candidatus Berkelbacteria bacterium]